MLKGTLYRDLDLAERAAQAAYEASEHRPADRFARNPGLLADRPVRQVKTGPTADTKSKLSKYSGGIFKTDDPAVLSSFARILLVAPDLNYRDLDLALRAAEAANTGSKGQDPSILNTYALALFKNGKGAQALELTRKALALTKDERMTQCLRKSLEFYQHPIRRHRPTSNDAGHRRRRPDHEVTQRRNPPSGMMPQARHHAAVSLITGLTACQPGRIKELRFRVGPGDMA